MRADDELRDDEALLDAAGRRLRHDSGVPVSFGGLQASTDIPIVMSHGHRSNALTTLRIRPDRGLGGRSWSRRSPMLVGDYGSSRAITHDYDGEILAERLTTLAVAPILVRHRVRGLLYAGSRDEDTLTADQLATLKARAAEIAFELDVRDEVDARTRALRAAVVGDPTADLTAGLRERIGRIAEETRDERTRAELDRLLEGVEVREGVAPLTARQVDVLRQVALGASNDEIARRLGLSVVTVKSYLRDVYRALGARSRFDAVIRARQAGVRV